MIRKTLPGYEWLRTYKGGDLKGDLSAGMIVAIVLIPQGMAYAKLAGLPVVMGLYASAVPIVYSLFGSSRHLAVGPVAMMSLLVFQSGSKFAPLGSEGYITCVLLLALMVGTMQFLIGTDILKTAVAPTWNDIGQLAAVVAIRTVLNFFLTREPAQADRSNRINTSLVTV